MSLTINIPEWFGWIAVAFVAIYATALLFDSYWKWDQIKWERKQREATSEE